MVAEDNQRRGTATSFGLVRWSETMQAFVAYLDGLVNDELGEMGRSIDAARAAIGWRMGFGVFVYLFCIHTHTKSGR